MKHFRLVLSILAGLACLAADDFSKTPYIVGRDFAPQDVKVLKKVQPEYPEVERRRGRHARLAVLSIIKTDGSVQFERLAHCYRKHESDEWEKTDNRFCENFLAPTRAAVTSWKYEPLEKDGRPVDVYIVIMVDFTIQGP